MTEIKRYEFELYHCNGADMSPCQEGGYVGYEDHAEIVAALQEQVLALAEFRARVRASFKMGELAEDFAVFVNIENALRRSNCLSSIEREFFTREVPDEDYPDEIGEACDLSWGKEPTEYTEDFRKALREIRAQGVEGFCDLIKDYGKVEPDYFNPDFADLYAKIYKEIYESILDNPAVHDMGSLLDWLEAGASNSRAYADMAIKCAARIRAGEQP